MDKITSPSSPRARFIASLFIGAYLALQIAAPLSYYLAKDPMDERFAWRMFSTVWQARKSCSIEATEWVRLDEAETIARSFDFKRQLHWNWQPILTKSSENRVRKFLETRCLRDPAIAQVRFVRSCDATMESIVPSADITMVCPGRISSDHGKE